MAGEPPRSLPPALIRADHHEPSVFLPENLLREARRQRDIPSADVPDVCLLDPDGDVIRFLQQTDRGRRAIHWACYHTNLWQVETSGETIGIVGNAVGAPFAVLVAEELFASGGKLVVSVTSAGQLDPRLALPATILIERALRGEGTSYAYLPPSQFVAGDQALLDAIGTELAQAGLVAVRGGVWTTDAPFRETRSAIDAAASQGLLAIEMEAAGLYAFAAARGRPVVCFALMTNQMAQDGDDFEKGPDDGAGHALALTVAAARAWRKLQEPNDRRHSHGI